MIKKRTYHLYLNEDEALKRNKKGERPFVQVKTKGAAPYLHYPMGNGSKGVFMSGPISVDTKRPVVAWLVDVVKG